MSATCIVCLGDLEEDRKPIKTESPSDLPTASDTGGAEDGNGDAELIAHLLPCGHDLHNECLKPWVERANSCPICRQNFNHVTLIATVGGPEISSYSVDDKVQVAELDPSMLYEDVIEDDFEPQPCDICGCDDNQELLLLCEGCDHGFHIGCVGLDYIPAEDFWCNACTAERALNGEISVRNTSRGQTLHGRFQPSQGRHLRSLRAAHFYHWERVWQSVWDNLNLDLDNPSEDEEGLSQYRQSQRLRRMSHRSRQAAWEARQDVAEEQGGPQSRFEDTRPALLNRFARRRKSETPSPVAQDELRAWDAFDKATEVESARPGKRKRQSNTTSPVDPETAEQPERKLKRPNTKNSRRLQELGESSTSATARPTNGNSSSRNEPTPTGTSWLQSILKTVGDEPSSASNGLASGSKRGSVSTAGPPRDHRSPASSASPGSSPVTSSYSTPRAMSRTPPPLSPAGNRPGSPMSLTSRVEPIFPQHAFSPETSPSEPIRPTKVSRTDTKEPRHSRAQRVEAQSRSSEPSRSRPRTRPTSRHGTKSSPDTSPERAWKLDIQNLVKSSLRPFHQLHGLSKEHYTVVNRDVSRMLYSRVGDTDISDADSRATWQKIADSAVAKAVAELEAT
ncbi:MAG: 60S ribosomal protein L43 [Chaenotheca gracillima]|nr:MAG: 60S ribosomal protein L43 [Chaenotheca gracillima]